MSKSSEVRVPCSNRTRDRLRQNKRGGMTYDELFQRMLEQYEPDSEQGAENP